MSISQKWKDTINKAINDARWDAYDATIQDEVTAYEKRFPALSKKVNWKFIKAMLWTESGGPDNAAWKARALQIGNAGDPAYNVLKSGKEGSDIIMTETLFKKVKSQSIETPTINIQAGIAYLYTRMSKSVIASVKDLKDTKEYAYKVVGGDSLDKISKKVGTTVFELRRLNPKASGIIRPGMDLKYVKASMKRTITGWRTFDAKTIAERYNGGGDPNYADKLTYIINDVLPKLVRKP